MRRLVLLAACLALLCGGARAAVAVRMEDAAALLSEDGAQIVAEGAYADIVALGGGWFAASEDGERYSLMGEDGALLSEARYDALRPGGELLLAHRDDGWGLLDPSGAELGAFVYDEILPTGEGGWWALRPDGELKRVLTLDAEGRARDSGLRALRAGEPGEGLLPLEMEDRKWGYCDASGRLAIPARYDWAGRFACGLAPAVEGGGYGAIDESGAWVAEPRYEFLEISSQGFLLASGAGEVAVLARDGSEIARYANAWGALAGAGYVICDGESLRAFDGAGALLEELAPDAAVSEGLDGQLVISEGMWGETCVRLMGTRTAYQNLYPLGTAGGAAVYACMEVNAARYENDLLHEIQVSVDMDSARYGLVDAAGEQLLPCYYLSIEALADDRFLARTESQWQLIDSSGRIYWRSERVTRTEAPSF